MTNLPPPQPGYQPPQQPSYDPGGGGSTYTPGQPFVPAPQPPREPKQRNKKVLLIGVGVIVVAALVVGGFLFFKKDDKKSAGGGAFDVKTAKRTIDDIIDAANVSDGSFASLNHCPMGDPDDIAEKSPVDFDAVTVARGTEQQFIENTKNGSFVVCIASDKKQKNFFAVFAADAPKGDYNKFVKNTSPDSDITFEKTSTFRGGTVHPYCGTPKKGSSDQPFCQADWENGSLATGILISGRDVTPELATQFLEAELPSLVNQLDTVKADDFPPVTQPG